MPTPPPEGSRLARYKAEARPAAAPPPAPARKKALPPEFVPRAHLKQPTQEPRLLERPEVLLRAPPYWLEETRPDSDELCGACCRTGKVLWLVRSVADRAPRQVWRCPTCVYSPAGFAAVKRYFTGLV